MKRKLILRFFGSLLALLLITGASAQEKDTMKLLPPITVYSTTNVSQKVTNAFGRHFKNSVGQRWYQADKNFLVRFIQNDMKNTALFKKNGYLIYHISYGTERNLPDNIREMVKGAYEDYNITSAINVEQDNRNIWVINLEGLKKQIIVRVEEGELEEVENFEKSV